MSKTEILAELRRLDHRDRREIARRLFEIEADAQSWLIATGARTSASRCSMP